MKRHEVEILLRAGHRQTEAARLTGVPLFSVKRIAQEGPVVHVDDAERVKRQIGNKVRLPTRRRKQPSRRRRRFRGSSVLVQPEQSAEMSEPHTERDRGEHCEPHQARMFHNHWYLQQQ